MGNYILNEDSYLSHHGILGQKWGVRRYQNPDGTLTEEGKKRYAYNNLKEAKMYNMEKFGSDKHHNVCYILGASGSGKSTTAQAIAKNNDQVIHLDTIFEKQNHKSGFSNKDFNNFLKDNKIDINKATDLSIDRKERYKEIDKIGDAIEKYAEKKFKTGQRVIVEGVQMGDDTLFPDKSYFKDRCIIELPINYLKNMVRAYNRDSESTNIYDLFERLTDKERINWYSYMRKRFKEIESYNKNNRNDEEIIDSILNKYYDKKLKDL